MAVVVGHSVVVHTDLGDLRGTTEGGVGVWRGVPYAEQPVGDRRFLGPEPKRPWTGLRDAVEHGPLPPQEKSFVGGGRDDPKVRDEACLTLTVWSPDSSASLPVMVWIPGGAFVYGAGQFQLYNGSRLAANGNVVVVNITYRIGVFGGFELGDLGDGFDDNLALRDQIAALGWIRDHIAAFGGDPARVTVFGESAGGTSVLALLASPAAEGLFARAIAQSPALPLIADRQVRAEQAHEFLRRLGVPVAEVKRLPQRRLRRAAGSLQLESAATTPTLAYGLTYGVDLLPSHPVDAARDGRVRRVPLIIGTNSHEASMFAWTKPPMLPTTRASIDAYFARVAPDAKERVLAAYPDYPRRRALIAFGSDVMFGGPAWAFADAYSGHAPTHVYRFDHVGFSLRMLGLGATHGSEIVHIQHSYASYLGRKMHPLGRRLQPSVGRRMQRTWLDFAAKEWETGEIRWSSGHDWPVYDTEHRYTRIIMSARDDIVEDPDVERRLAWAGLY
ncbi:carboxylesterase/lipase family protein [Mycolicibacterium celeriflavum]|uniref:carboxylesterase/lipase family protein n=1 Tax=Mycolicibacterium celeriflavum TaxID=1249101 RepID=UPI0009F1CF2C|nr:carboxylesterase/lipase family protein [Mycolicibacterium celeriflavum]MCV7237086.1 carboxylesterase/lipase family protein [Mycolicibacterium celeriflavum]ORA48905.1 carboxylesterase [Mycolicibacterium celeriflavum]